MWIIYLDSVSANSEKGMGSEWAVRVRQRLPSRFMKSGAAREMNLVQIVVEAPAINFLFERTHSYSVDNQGVVSTSSSNGPTATPLTTRGCCLAAPSCEEAASQNSSLSTNLQILTCGKVFVRGPNQLKWRRMASTSGPHTTSRCRRRSPPRERSPHNRHRPLRSLLPMLLYRHNHTGCTRRIPQCPQLVRRRWKQ